MKKTKGILLVLTACIALFIFNGCKARHVIIKQTDSTAVHQTTKIDESVKTHTDSSQTNTKTVTIKTDTGTREITITPVAGKTITINKDGSFVGEASKVDIKEKKAVSKSVATDAEVKKAIHDFVEVKSSVTSKDSIHVKSKDKTVDAKPSYGWMIYAGIALIIVGWLLWRFLKPKL